MNMDIERLRKSFRKNYPILAKEITDSFSEYSRTQVYRYIQEWIAEEELEQYSEGVYFMPEMTELGPSKITPDLVIKKKFIGDDEKIYGITCGLDLLNRFSITTQVPSVIEITTNNEATRGREVRIKDRRFIVKKSRTMITKENAPQYTIMQLLNDVDDLSQIDDEAWKKILAYLTENNVKKEDLLDMSSFFSGKAIKRLLISGVLNEAA